MLHQLNCIRWNQNVFFNEPSPFEVSLLVAREGSASQPQVKLVEDNERKYGGQDIFFSFKAQSRGFKIGIVDGIMCNHPVVSDSDKDWYKK